ncbi:MAG: phage holin family protein [Blautia sp.]|nr:phage holin family protein [Blautia sp.]
MKDLAGTMHMMVTVTGGILGGILGGWDGLLKALVILMVCDYLTGILAAAILRELSSRIGFIGIGKKIAMMCVVAMAAVIDLRILGQGGAIRSATICFYCFNECLSITENCRRIHVTFPGFLPELAGKEQEECDKGDPLKPDTMEDKEKEDNHVQEQEHPADVPDAPEKE